MSEHLEEDPTFSHSTDLPPQVRHLMMSGHLDRDPTFCYTTDHPPQVRHQVYASLFLPRPLIGSISSR